MRKKLTLPAPGYRTRFPVACRARSLDFCPHNRSYKRPLQRTKRRPYMRSKLDLSHRPYVSLPQKGVGRVERTSQATNHQADKHLRIVLQVIGMRPLRAVKEIFFLALFGFCGRGISDWVGYFGRFTERAGIHAVP